MKMKDAMSTSDQQDSKERARSAVDRIADIDLWNGNVLRKNCAGKIWDWESEIDRRRRQVARTRSLELLRLDTLDTESHEDTIWILTEFELGLRLMRMVPKNITSPECELLEPVAQYLAAPSIRSSFITRYFASMILVILQSRLSVRAKIGRWAEKFVIFLCIILLLLLNRREYLWVLMNLISARPETVLGLVVLGFAVRWIWRGAKANMLLDKLLSQFGNIRVPAQIDGQELCRELRKLERLGMDVPSILYTLFRLISPGH